MRPPCARGRTARRASRARAPGRLDRGERLERALRAAGQLTIRRRAQDAGDAARGRPSASSGGRRRASSRRSPGSRSRAGRACVCGVTSRGPSPVPPVRHDEAMRVAAPVTAAVADALDVVRDDRALDREAELGQPASSAGARLSSPRVPRKLPSLMVRTKRSRAAAVPSGRACAEIRARPLRPRLARLAVEPAAAVRRGRATRRSCRRSSTRAGSTGSDRASSTPLTMS